MIALELAAGLIRGLRDSASGRFVEIAVREGEEEAALREALAELGGRGEIRLVLRTVPSLTTLIVDAPPEEIGPISQHVPLATREIVSQEIGRAHV